MVVGRLADDALVLRAKMWWPKMHVSPFTLRQSQKKMEMSTLGKGKTKLR
jgi:hypothetical protein